MDGELREKLQLTDFTQSGDREDTKMYREEASQQIC